MKTNIKSLNHAKKGSGMAGALVGIAITVVIVASVAIPLITAVDTTGFSATDILLIGLLPTLLLLAVVMAVVYKFL